MVWFKVDDKLHSHRKALRAGSHALGLWVLAGSWSADQLTDGWVPNYVARNLSVTWEEDAARLVAAGLWQPGEFDGDEGWWFHEWVGNGQPSREDIEKKRRDQRERVKRWRERHGYDRSSNSGDTDVSDTVGNTLPTVSQSGNTLPNTLVTVPPTRPDPKGRVGEVGSMSPGLRNVSGKETLPDTKKSGEKQRRATRIPEPFVVTAEMVEWAKTNTPNVDGRLETAQFSDYWRAKAGRDALKLDWLATWRGWMRKAEQQAARPRRGSVTTDADWEALK